MSVFFDTSALLAVLDAGDAQHPHARTAWASGETQHRLGVAALVAAGRRHLSLVDCVSFATMREPHLDAAFAFDRDFADQGFRTLP
jgi:predicted nucleic acid-binding protein